jgi:hypothetical protein
VACTKTKYDNRAEAEAALNLLGPELGDFSMMPYPCPECAGWWHVGHGDPRDKQRAILGQQMRDVQANPYTDPKKKSRRLAVLQARLDCITPSSQDAPQSPNAPRLPGTPGA